MKAGRVYRDTLPCTEGGSANAQHHLAPGAAVPARAAAGQNRTMSPNRTLLLTDVVDSTKLSAELGDAAMAEVWAAHDRVARDLLPPWRGREIDKTDGMLLLFETAADGVNYARRTTAGWRRFRCR